jgi:ubiquinone biosynthesis protein UbiJ
MSTHRGIPFAIGLALILAVYAPVSPAQVLQDSTGGGAAPPDMAQPGLEETEVEVPELTDEQLSWITRLAEVMPMPKSLAAEAAALVVTPAVQEELELTDDQKARLGRLVQEKMKRSQGDVQVGQLVALNQEYETAVEGSLTPSQRERLTQIVLQKKGPWAVAEPEVAAKLRLNLRQQVRIQMILSQVQMAQGQAWAALSERSRARRNGGPPSAEITRAMAEVDTLRRDSDKLRDELSREIGRVLTRQQKDSFNKLLGEPFDFTRSRPAGSDRKQEDGTPR